MTNSQGDFIWYELLTTDDEAAREFYGRVLGWTFRATETPNGPYWLCSCGSLDVAGIMTLPPEAQAGGARPFWVPYIGVEDVDAAADAIKKAGGTEHMPPMDMPEVGRFAMLSDPQGAMLYVMRGASDEESRAFSHETPGHCNWNELATTDQAAALDFYCGLFGWDKGDAMPMGELGDYQFVNQGESMIGAIMTREAGGPPPAWMFYFGVTDIDTAAGVVAESGGRVMRGPEEIPGGMYMIVVADPAGAAVGFVGPRVSGGAK